MELIPIRLVHLFNVKYISSYDEEYQKWEHSTVDEDEWEIEDGNLIFTGDEDLLGHFVIVPTPDQTS